MTALKHVRVLELGEGIAPSIVGMFLADFGADVVKIERPSGDPTRRLPGFATWNRGKRSITIDHSADHDRSWLAQSLKGADVCIVGAAQALSDFGVDVVQAAESNARLVSLKMPAYLAGRDVWVGGRESSGLLSARAGVSWRQASDDGSPVEPVYQHLAYVQGVWSTVCAVAALVERERSGFGQQVTVTGMNAVLEAAVYALTVDPNAPDPPTAVGSLGRHPTYRPVRAADGWLASGALGPKFERRLLGILGISHLLDDPRLGGKTQHMVLPENLAWSMEQISEAFRRKPRQHWIETLGKAGIPCGPLLDRDAWLDHPQVVANGLRVEVEDPERGVVVMPGIPITLTGTPGAIHGPAPRLGHHNGAEPWSAQVQPEGSAPITAGPLSHVTVINMGTFVASPYSGFLFSELGADVIKVEPLTGDPFRNSAFAVNRGMRSLAIDLQSENGRELFHRIARQVDIVTDGMRPGVMSKLGIDYEALKALKPDIISTSLAAYGMHGELANAGGVDMVVQAMSGMMFAQGDEEHPVSNTIAILDVTTAAMTVLASVLALFHRERTGEGQWAWDSLVGTSTLLASGELTRFEGRAPALQGAPDYKGPAPLDRFYRVSDGWIRVQADEESEVTTEALKQAGLVVDDISAESLIDALAGVAGAEAVAAFAQAGIPAVEARKPSCLFRDQQVLASDAVHFRRADDGTTLATPGRYATFSRTQRVGPLTPPGVGEHTEEILRDVGMSQEKISAAVERRVVAKGSRNPITLGAIYR